jgi:hypothetical protein
VKPNKKLLNRIQDYYFHRTQQKVGKSWNKQEDLNRIETVARTQGFAFEAAAGTFFLSWRTPTKKLRRTLVISEKTFPQGELEREEDEHA